MHGMICMYQLVHLIGGKLLVFWAKTPHHKQFGLQRPLGHRPMGHLGLGRRAATPQRHEQNPLSVGMLYLH